MRSLDRIRVALVLAVALAGGYVSAEDRSVHAWMQDARAADTRARALEHFRAASAPDLPDLRSLLGEARKVPGEGVARVLGDPRKACRANAPDDDRWLACLVEQLEGKSTVNAKSATAFACVAIGARAVGGIDGLTLLGSLALDAGGALDQVVTRTLSRGGDAAVAALYMMRRDGDVKLRKWATERLEALKMRRPAEVSTLTDPVALARVLGVFGAWREPDALPLLLDLVDAERREVREAAREGVRAFGREGIWRLREAWRNVAGMSPPDDWYSKRLADELFARLDSRRIGPAMEALAAARALAAEGKLDEAGEAAARALRLAPDHPERAELAGLLVRSARNAAGTPRPVEERERLLERAAWAGGPPLEAELDAELRAVHADVLARRGVADATLTGRLSPEAQVVARASRTAWPVAALLGLAGGLAWAAEWLRRRGGGTSPK